MPDWITVETTLPAPLSQVWAAYTLPRHIMGWNFASPDWHCPRAEADLRTGGRFSFRMEARDGSMGFDFAGTYTQVIAQTLIAYDMGPRQAEVRFTPQGNAVHVAVRFEPETDNPPALQQAGWQAILDQFAHYVASGGAAS